ncbi:adenylate/guanylate cyclase domain-containing protein [Rubrivirga sp. IMCC45206]|uniref:adenylate/guanylate cyclase domain-containing protein n=1 Tax=Rubrivirga sp. IMCC45206 TaxID=3391614 RepID=UPI0039900BB4
MSYASPARTHLRRALRLAPALVAAWATASFVAARLSGVAAVEALPMSVSLGRALATGLLVGLPAAWLESSVLARTDRRFGAGLSLLLRTAAYTGIVVFATVGLVFLLNGLAFGRSPADILGDRAVVEFLLGRPFLSLVVLLMLASFVVNLTVQLRRVLGPETLLALLIGQYRRPVREERAFLFLDLTDSTMTAERLGPLRFTDFKNDFFTDVAEAVLATRGRIFQYVGDEAVITWPLDVAQETGAPIECFFLAHDLVARRAGHYERRYGTAPRFKGGVHGGEVFTAEIGEIRRGIVHSGDVVNTAARIEGQCRPLGRTLLTSDDFAERLQAAWPDAGDYQYEPVGEIPLRGKAAPVGLVAVERPVGQRVHTRDAEARA